MPKKQNSTYYCWYQYYDSDVGKTIKSDEIAFFKGHKHGVRPSDKDKKKCMDDLIAESHNLRGKKA